jgi:hypothetical protein
VADGSNSSNSIANRIVLVVGIVAIGGVSGMVLKLAGLDGWMIGLITSVITLILVAILLRSAAGGRRGH